MVPALAMTAQLSPALRHDGRLWAVAFGLSLVLNVLLLMLAGVSFLTLEKFQPARTVAAPSAESVQFIAPELAASAPESPAAAAPAAAAPAPADPSFVRTSDDQRSPRPERPAFIGERDTQATSDIAPTPDAPALPAQAGVEPRHQGDLETTVSRYQDGELTADSVLPQESPSPPAPDALPLAPTPPANAAAGQKTPNPGPDATRAAPPAADRLATGPHPVDLPIAKQTPSENPTPATAQRPKEGQPDAPDAPNSLKEAPPAAQPQPTPHPPAFRGNQRKTAIRGSISRAGRSALDVEDNALGRYQAIISRAVELEWQRNCIRYRDFITPGYLTVKFSVDAAGKVRSVDFEGMMQTSQHQKGFTLNSIRDATIPPMPPELKKDFQDTTLDLIFNFYF
ncbi:MAG: hypothetical protein RLZZ522_1685 [Verrucomicrobiota bacterium]